MMMMMKEKCEMNRKNRLRHFQVFITGSKYATVLASAFFPGSMEFCSLHFVDVFVMCYLCILKNRMTALANTVERSDRLADPSKF